MKPKKIIVGIIVYLLFGMDVLAEILLPIWNIQGFLEDVSFITLAWRIILMTLLLWMVMWFADMLDRRLTGGECLDKIRSAAMDWDENERLPFVYVAIPITVQITFGAFFLLGQLFGLFGKILKGFR